MDDRELAKLLTQAGEDPNAFVGTASQMNPDGTVTVTGRRGSVTAIAQTAFRSGAWSVKRVGGTWYAWSTNSPIVEAESTIQRRSKSKKKKEVTVNGLVVLISVTQSGQEHFYAISETDPIEEVAVLPIDSAYSFAHLSFVGRGGKKSFLFACAYKSSPTDSTDNTGIGYFVNPTHYTIVMKGLQNWILNSYFEETIAGGIGLYVGSGFWASYVVVGATSQSAAFYTYGIKSKIDNTYSPVKKMVLFPSPIGYLVAPGVTKIVDTDKVVYAHLLSVDKKSMFYFLAPFSDTPIEFTPTNSRYIRKRLDAELIVVAPPSMMFIPSLTVCEYKDKIYNFHPWIGFFPFNGSISLDEVKAHGIRVYSPTISSDTITYKEESERISIKDFQGIDTLPSGVQIKVHSAYYG